MVDCFNHSKLHYITFGYELDIKPMNHEYITGETLVFTEMRQRASHDTYILYAEDVEIFFLEYDRDGGTMGM